ncbi:hypothetical protein [Actinoplanes sp. NPDC051859]|uniref:hypothetical protein n=1 Tax=Actinoplanes sp. NPDC051859 TaxID=3363909 RepID=UPI0037A99FCD
MQLLHHAEKTKSACVDEPALRRAFGTAWEMVATALTLLLNVANLAEVAQFACVTLRRLATAADGVVRFVVRHGDAEIFFRAADAALMFQESEKQSDAVRLMQRIRVIVIEGITVPVPMPV